MSSGSGGREGRGRPARRGGGSAAASAARRKQSRRTRKETSAGGVVFRLSDGRPLLLLIRDSYGNWGFPKGHLEDGERADTAALREVMEETGLQSVTVISTIATIEWHFRFRGKLIHKHCEFFLMESADAGTKPQRSEGITACRWMPADEAERLIVYENARDVLRRASEMLAARSTGESRVGTATARTG